MIRFSAVVSGADVPAQWMSYYFVAQKKKKWEARKNTKIITFVDTDLNNLSLDCGLEAHYNELENSHMSIIAS